jgi:hypothetical protein
MALIKVYRDEAGGEFFPRLCMQCGEPADCEVPQTFAWMPSWVHFLILLGLAPWLIVALITRKTMRVTAPMCDRHRGHWRSRKLFIGLGLAFFIALFIGLVAVGNRLPDDVLTPVIASGLLAALIWLIAGLIIMNGAIRAAEILHNRIDLSGVHPEFARAWRDMLRQEREEREARRERAPVAERPRRD